MTTHRHQQKQQAGFTLIEVLVAIAIIGIIAAIGIPNFYSMRTNATLRAEARDILSNLRKAQSEAVKRSDNIALHLDLDNNHYFLFEDSTKTRPTNTTGNNILLDNKVIFVSGLRSGATITTGSLVLAFDAQGQPYDDSGSTSTDAAGHVILSTSFSSALQYRISLNLAGSGKVEVSQDGGTTWQ